MLGCPRAQLMTTANDAIQPVLRLPIVFEGMFFRAERPRVIVAAAIDDASRMFDVQHLVKDDVLDKPFGNLTRVKSLTDRDRVMRRIVMPKNASGFSPRPGEHRPGVAVRVGGVGGGVEVAVGGGLLLVVRLVRLVAVVLVFLEVVQFLGGDGGAGGRSRKNARARITSGGAA